MFQLYYTHGCLVKSLLYIFYIIYIIYNLVSEYGYKTETCSGY
jgi:hypothetical protein